MTVIGGSVLASPSLAATGIWRRSTYVPLVGQSFTVRGYSTPLQLIRIDDVSKRLAGSQKAFVLIFRASGGPGALPHGLPRLSNSSLGSFSMFLSPVLSQSSDATFAAVIDRTHG
ncbi:MAG TPA: hypothetical protein VGI87_04100 [Solirubrobacteraceae bacterium]|jgi:hypothetical protein